MTPLPLNDEAIAPNDFILVTVPSHEDMDTDFPFAEVEIVDQTKEFEPQKMGTEMESQPQV